MSLRNSIVTPWTPDHPSQKGPDIETESIVAMLAAVLFYLDKSQRLALCTSALRAYMIPHVVNPQRM